MNELKQTLFQCWVYNIMTSNVRSVCFCIMDLSYRLYNSLLLMRDGNRSVKLWIHKYGVYRLKTFRGFTWHVLVTHQATNTKSREAKGFPINFLHWAELSASICLNLKVVGQPFHRKLRREKWAGCKFDIKAFFYLNTADNVYSYIKAVSRSPICLPEIRTWLGVKTSCFMCDIFTHRCLDFVGGGETTEGGVWNIL